MNSKENSLDHTGVPGMLRFGAVVVLLQCLAMLGYIIMLIYAQIEGISDSSIESSAEASHYVALGTAVFLAIVFGFVAFVAISTLQGRPRGSGAIVLIEAILLGVAFYMFLGGAHLLSAATALPAVLVLITVFHPASAAYQEAMYELKKARR
ncbi:hypothetical protein [Corynebacterium sp. CCUG 61414]|uniref:hypothetical protein n=1 Tax=Corynebacterium sp. CCUG 61414 TaxID=2823896 RepID=UPI00210B866D